MTLGLGSSAAIILWCANLCPPVAAWMKIQFAAILNAMKSARVPSPFIFIICATPARLTIFTACAKANIACCRRKFGLLKGPSLYAYGTFKNLTVLPRGARPKTLIASRRTSFIISARRILMKRKNAINEGKTPDETNLKTAEEHLLSLVQQRRRPQRLETARRPGARNGANAVHAGAAAKRRGAHGALF